MFKNFIRAIAAITLTLSLAACFSKEDASPFVGQWYSPNFYLKIEPDGEGTYLVTYRDRYSYHPFYDEDFAEGEIRNGKLYIRQAGHVTVVTHDEERDLIDVPKKWTPVRFPDHWTFEDIRRHIKKEDWQEMMRGPDERQAVLDRFNVKP